MNQDNKSLDIHLKAILEKTLFSVLEQHFFLMLDPLNEELIDILPPGFFEVSMGFNGDLNGEFLLFISENACAEAYAGMSGSNDPGLKTEIVDTANEILNYLGPNILIEWAERMGQPLFEVSIPICREIGQSDWDLVKNKPNRVSFSTNDEPIYLFVHLRDKNFE